MCKAVARFLCLWGLVIWAWMMIAGGQT